MRRETEQEGPPYQGEVKAGPTPLEFDVNTFRGDLKLAALRNLDGLNGLVACGGRAVFDLLDKLVTLENFAKHNVTSIEPAELC